MPLRSRWAVGALFLSMLVVAACSTDQFASPPPPTPDSPAAGPAPSFLFLAFTTGQAACEAATPRRDFAGKFLGWQVAQQRPAIARTAADTGMVNLQLIRFAKGTRLQTDFVNCVLPNNDASRAFMRDYFKSTTRPPGIGLGIVAASVMEFLTCYWDGNGWNCGHGMYCQSAWNGLRAAPATGTVIAAPSSMQEELGTFTSTGGGSDGCWIDVQDYGTSTYYHTWGGTCDETEPEEGGGGGGGQGPPGTCNPVADPTCYIALDAQDTALFINALATLRPLSEFTDSAAATVCLELYTRFNQMLFSGRVYKGKPDNADGHAGFFFRDTIHVDQDIIAAVRNGSDGLVLQHLLGLSLHEAGHSIKTADGQPKYAHAQSDLPGGYPFPFNHTSPANISEANACAKYP